MTEKNWKEKEKKVRMRQEVSSLSEQWCWFLQPVFQPQWVEHLPGSILEGFREGTGLT